MFLSITVNSSTINNFGKVQCPYKNERYNILETILRKINRVEMSSNRDMMEYDCVKPTLLVLLMLGIFLFMDANCLEIISIDNGNKKRKESTQHYGLLIIRKFVLCYDDG